MKIIKVYGDECRKIIETGMCVVETKTRLNVGMKIKVIEMEELHTTGKTALARVKSIGLGTWYDRAGDEEITYKYVLERIEVQTLKEIIYDLYTSGGDGVDERENSYNEGYDCALDDVIEILEGEGIL